ncbi:MAG: septal ring lytic transglycosylase RlpA family lipoprotein [Rhizobiales bacterium]|nr:septal ring lytic transglycosylase RlpA family lipoprotein [Hoeflea sp.]MBG20939.1 septal ring lytic transglycosylase RlpA family lipoprotein [Hyphomicrobiales bacterium]|tara:strand:- start:5085 stop:5456 length:372 start_codon:yes stop_codon:yes gene_type:complete
MKTLASLARVAAPVTATLVLLVASAAPSLAANGCGKASWYALHSKTASGERMDPSKLTAAHRSLRFGTKLQVTNRKTGKSVVVRVNDRGPFIRGRVLDVSKAAASHLGMVNSGVANVCFKVLS